MRKKTILLHLSLINGIGPKVINTLVKLLPKELHLSEIYSFSIADFNHTFGLREKTAEKVVTGLQDFQELEQELKLLEKNRFSIVSLYDENYPELLKHIAYPPPILYVHGAPLKKVEPSLAIVGSRKANFYAKRFITSIVPELLDCGFTIVSGGAIGADSMAHQATLESQGRTIAVLGSGLLNKYPARNYRLFQNIITNGGSIVSPFKLHYVATPGSFPARNRIIAGLSQGCIVAQAAKKSGARITANYALEQGRDVFALPGSIEDPLSAGCHSLIKLGAKLVTNVQDIIEEYGLVIPTKKTTKRKVCNEIDSNILPNSNENKIVQACQMPISIDELVNITHIPLSNLNMLLFELQLEGKIKQNMAGTWQQV